MTAGRSWLLSWTKMRRTSRTLLGWSKSTRSSWMRTRVCPCTTRTAKNSWNSSGYSNRRGRGHPDQAEMKLNCPQHPHPTYSSIHPILLRCTNTTLSHLLHTHSHTDLSCVLHSVLADLTCRTGPRGPNRHWVCSPGVLLWQSSWLGPVFLNVRRKISGLLGSPGPFRFVCVCVSVSLSVHLPPPPNTHTHQPQLFQSKWKVAVTCNRRICRRLWLFFCPQCPLLGLFCLPFSRFIYHRCWLIFAFGHILSLKWIWGGL